MANRLQEKYKNEVVPSMIEKFNYSSIMQAPKLDKIVINMGVGDAVSNAKNLENAVEELTLIAGQKPVITTARNQSLVSVYVKVCQSVPKLLYVANVCMNSSTN